MVCFRSKVIKRKIAALAMTGSVWNSLVIQGHMVTLSLSLVEPHKRQIHPLCLTPIIPTSTPLTTTITPQRNQERDKLPKQNQTTALTVTLHTVCMQKLNVRRL